jgi:hypothetical protein
MTILQTACDSYKTELLSGIHAFGTTVIRASTDADVFKLALYAPGASLSSSTTVYSTTDEVVGTGYSAGGVVLTINPTPLISNGVAYLGFNNASWVGASFAAIAALIYNSSQGNKAVAVLYFGASKVAVNQTFTVVFPTADYTNAILRVS